MWYRLARNMGLRVPPECEQLNQLCRDLNRALAEGASLVVEHEDVVASERWLIMLREQLGRAKKQDLVELLDRSYQAGG